jgi:hypothetical protein
VPSNDIAKAIVKIFSEFYSLDQDMKDLITKVALLVIGCANRADKLPAGLLQNEIVERLFLYLHRYLGATVKSNKFLSLLELDIEGIDMFLIGAARSFGNSIFTHERDLVTAALECTVEKILLIAMITAFKCSYDLAVWNADFISSLGSMRMNEDYKYKASVLSKGECILRELKKLENHFLKAIQHNTVSKPSDLKMGFFSLYLQDASSISAINENDKKSLLKRSM